MNVQELTEFCDYIKGAVFKSKGVPYGKIIGVKVAPNGHLMLEMELLEEIKID